MRFVFALTGKCAGAGWTNLPGSSPDRPRRDVVTARDRTVARSSPRGVVMPIAYLCHEGSAGRGVRCRGKTPPARTELDSPATALARSTTDPAG